MQGTSAAQMRAAALGMLRNNSVRPAASSRDVVRASAGGAVPGKQSANAARRTAVTQAAPAAPAETARGSGQYAAASAAAASRVAIVDDRATSAATKPNIYNGVFGMMDSDGDLPSLKPADADAARFELHPSVAFWHDYAPEVADDEAPLNEQLSWLARSIQEGVEKGGLFSTTSRAAYWSYHLGRSAFFMVQGVIGLLAARTASVATGESESSTGVKLEGLFKAGTARPIMEALTTYAQDLQNIEAGYYKMPYDMTSGLRHRQFNPLFVLRKGALFMQEAAHTISRRTLGDAAATDVWLQSKLYPDYFMNTFHFQTDGWFSADSAEIYESSTETLFLGRQDAMQRSTLVPLARHLQSAGVQTGAGLKLLEVACGTGRFATYIKDNWPEMEITCLDLSPFYLAKARENMRYWKSLRAARMESERAFYMQAAAEAIPAADKSFDAVTCVYLFHELPAESRRKAAAEMARVLKPGGILVLTDSVQYGDRPEWDKMLGMFSKFNEPYYMSYISEDLGALFEEVGVVPDYKLVSSSSKTLSFRKL